jgi:hypothetical protein
MDEDFCRCLDRRLLRTAGYLNDSPAASLELLRPGVPSALVRVFIKTDQDSPSASSFGQYVPVVRAFG